MSLPAQELFISHECLNCHRHHPETAVKRGRAVSCPHCHSGDIEALPDAQPLQPFPALHARSNPINTVFAHAQKRGIDADELDGLTQAIQRLVRHTTTIITRRQAGELSNLNDLGYVSFSPTAQGTVDVELLVPGALLNSYFWSMWVPHHLQSRGYQTTVMPQLRPNAEVQHCTVAFRITGTREATRHFLADLAERFSDLQEAEIVHLQAGNVFDVLTDKTTGTERRGL
ncbi:hypothetical protein ACIQAL_22305 [Pseudomonas sp. NPDC088368]|uniref:hypothetical protein n=1 Tax=Pseudomonas sp. NPDC088368 TaxID=3364453 RepID=UPI0038213709